MHPLLAEFIGTTLLILLGNGVVANVLLPQSKGKEGGWIVITAGWSMAVFVGVYVSAPFSGAHLNPAVTLALALAGKFSWALVPGYVITQVAGAFTGSFLVWLVYWVHYQQPEAPGIQLATFSTSPAIKHPFANLITETVATAAFMLGVFYISSPGVTILGQKANFSLGAMDALPVAFLVFAIGLSLGGPTGYAINPARDFGPRLAHAVLPIPGKGSSEWNYAWIPILGPLAGAAVAAGIFTLLGN